MVTYDLSLRGSTPLYMYIYECIKSDITNGLLVCDTKLPSKRDLASHLKVSTLTVQNAYAQLLSEGYIYSKVKQGYYVAKVEQIPFAYSLNQITNDVSKESKMDSPSPLINLKSGGICIYRFPFSIWGKITRRVIENEGRQLLFSTPQQGILKLRQAICNHLLQFRGMKVSPEQVVVGAGTEYLYSLIIQLLGRDKIYGVENPGYSTISKIYSCNNAKCTHIDIDKSGMMTSSLNDTTTDVIHISPSHHFPTGAVMGITRRQELLEWAYGKKDRYIIEDDYDSEFRFEGRPIPAMQSIDQGGKVIYINTFSKSLAPSIRISYMVLPPSLVKEFKAKLGFYSCTVPSFEQYTLAEFMNEGHFERHINRMKNHYKENRDVIFKLIKNSVLWKKRLCEIEENNAGLHFLLHLKYGGSDDELISQCKSKGLSVSCLSQYYFSDSSKYSINKRENCKGTIVLNYSAISKAEMRQAVDSLCDIVVTNQLNIDNIKQR